jgi:hypothetical protein
MKEGALENGDLRRIDLPIRLAPSRQAALFGALFMVVWLGMLVFISSKMVPDAIQDMKNFKDNPSIILFIIVPLFMFCTGVPMFVFFAARFLPGSPFDHLSIREDGVVRRLTWKVKEAKWPDIHQFDCIQRTRKTKNGSQIYWLVMAERAGATARDPDQRAKDALLSFDSGTFAPAFNDKAEFARFLTDWLNGLLGDVRSGRLHNPISMPAALADAIRYAPEAGSGHRHAQSEFGLRPTKDPASKSSARKSVIER